MMPTVSVALFEKATRKSDLENDIKGVVLYTTMKVATRVFGDIMDNFAASRKSDSKDEGAQS